LPSPSRGAFAWVLDKEWRELMASKAWWIFLALIGPLVGFSFIQAVRTYGEASGVGGTAAGVGEAFSPLVGIWAPTFSACELAAAFLLPFVAIRLVSGDRQSGALKIELQHAMPSFVRVGAKGLVLAAGWIVASAAPACAMVLWKLYGGTLYAPELMSVAVGHFLNAGLTIALGAATAAMTEHPSTAAIATLGVTVGTWILNFVAAVQGGWWERAAAYTPTAMVAQFQHGLVRLDLVLATAALIAAGLALAAVWIRIGVATRRRIAESVVLGGVLTVLIAACTLARGTWDTSENRMNSFSESEEAALRQIRAPLRVEAHLAPEDPRRVDLDRQLAKVRRAVPKFKVDYISATSIGLFEQTSAHYGEIWYEAGGRRTMSRVITAEGVLESIFSVAGVAPPTENEDEQFRGHPLAATPTGAGYIFYGLWPAGVAAAALFTRRKDS